MKKVLIPFIFLLLGTSCASKKDIVYLNQLEGDKTEQLTSYITTLQPDDLLSIIVNSKASLLALDFNPPPVILQTNTESASAQQRIQTYLIDKDGFIEFPEIGPIKLGGLTRDEAVTALTEALKPHLSDARINLRILNYKISVQGEVARPGVYSIDSERVTLFQALSMAGDMSIYGKRKEVLIIREFNEKRTFTRIDITSPDFINSDFYYLKQNDVVYVEPNKTRINSSAVGPNLTVAISAISLLVTVFAVLTR